MSRLVQDLRQSKARALEEFRAKEIETLRNAFEMPLDAAARNRKRIAKKQKYSLTSNSVKGDTCDLFKRTGRMARTQKIGVDGHAALFGAIKPKGVIEIGGKLIPVRLATKA